MKPMVATVDEIGWPGGGEGYILAAAESVKSACFIPLVNRGRALGDLMIVRLTEGTFTAEDVEFLSQAAGQIATAIENALAYREISELKDKLAQEKLYLEEEIRSEMNFAEIVGKSSALRKVLKRVETVAPTDSTVLIYGETGAGKELIAPAIHALSPRKSKAFVKLNCAAIPTGSLESELLVRHFAQQFSKRMNKTIDTISSATMEALSRYHWPGNIRELQNVIERAVITSTGRVLKVDVADLKISKPSSPAEKGSAQGSTNGGLRDTLEETERQQILKALKQSNWVVAGPKGAAAKLGMKRSTLQLRMSKLGISRHSS